MAEKEIETDEGWKKDGGDSVCFVSKDELEVGGLQQKGDETNVACSALQRATLIWVGDGVYLHH